MSHFYGTIHGSRGEASRCGTKGSGMVTYCAGWGGSIRAEAYCARAEASEDDDVDMYRVYLSPWQSSGGSSILLSAGRLKSARVDDAEIEITPWARELFDSWLPEVDNPKTLDWMQRQIAQAYARLGT